MSDLAAAAAALGVPEALVKRSAEARAKASGTTVDEVLAAWAGGTSAPAPKPSVRVEAPDVSSQEDVESRASEEPATVRSTEAQVGSRTTEEALPPVSVAAIAAPPPPTEVTPREAIRYPVVVTVPTAGLMERTAASVPWWLAAFFVIIPLFGLLQLASATTNDCGAGTELLPDRVTGELRNCDGSNFEGRGAGGGGTDFLALGGELYLRQAACFACHGDQGQGVSAPALNTVLATFSSCADHIEWVTKGTSGFQAEGRDTYGDLNKRVGGVGTMPSFGSQLSGEQIAQAVAFERVRFGGANPEQTLIDCGLVTAEPGAGEEGEAAAGSAEEEKPGGGSAATTTTATP